MPTYEYACRGCSRRFEIIQPITAESLKECEECGGELRRVLFPAGIIYKGSGFYTTDYARKNGGSSSESGESKKEAKTDGKSESESKSKTEATKSDSTKSESSSTQSEAGASKKD